MALKRQAALLACCIVALLLDTAVLPRWNLFSLVPFVLLSLMLAAEQVFSLQTAILIGAFGGLLEDVLCESMIGLTPALCLIMAVLYAKLPRDSETKLPVLGLYCAILAFCLEFLRALVAYVIGMRFGFVRALLYGAMPRAILTGLWAMAFMSIFKPMLKRQVDAV